MKKIIEDLYKIDRQLLGVGYDKALEYIHNIIPLEILEVASGTELGTWTVPDEWIIRDGWVKYKGKKIIDYKKQPLGIQVYSEPFSGTISLEELKKHLYTNSTMVDATPYAFKFYDRDWGVCMPQTKADKLKEGDYEVFIDTEFVPGTMKIGIHTIQGTSEKEILLFAHLDHPYQANDNLSAVACLVDLAKKIKAEHTIKIVFCPETIGSIAYAHYEDTRNVDFVIAVDICGNNNSILVQKAFNEEARINRVAHCALQTMGKPCRKSKFRSVIGSDEYFFNDPMVGIPSLLFTTHPYDEYHTSEDTPDKINVEKIQEVQDLILKTIEIYEKDYYPIKTTLGPIMRSKYKLQSSIPQVNLNYDYFFYSLTGERTLAEICSDLEMPFEHIYPILETLITDGNVQRITLGQEQ